ncbi:restriction endonuclease subunit S [Limosilactobacillus albertensis]|uniref:Restriction endonuclease subunit S n=1 Tax=Limosilactobacillus albertensis TaxID=2759752 RepID=A0A839HAB0_9LACO|nr:restriction endonuclease subunit S [Limosilactobacillus albertensis]MBB1124426.1 restriction endonuclease subunit S [Limosilactobacillus albertensis]MCD7123160.1 restriction endonuclease subunit S [Limosilactobacillus albertensis]
MKMLKVTDREWRPIAINNLFSSFVPGKCSSVTHLVKSNRGIEYIGATNRNNGVLCYLKRNIENTKLIQPGNCIGFIKDGDGSAGYAIYKKEEFVSTVNVIFGYANWINPLTGLFFTSSQNLIKDKYNHGYKRNLQHLRADHVMLPFNEQEQPDFKFMEDFVRERMNILLNKYILYVKKQLINLGEWEQQDYLKYPNVNWKAFSVQQIFSTIQRGKRLKNDDHVSGKFPYVSSSAMNNGVADWVEPIDGCRVFTPSISLANSGSVGTAFYEPFNYVASDHITSFHLEEGNKEIYLFIATSLEKQKNNFGFNREVNEKRLKKLRVMLPVCSNGQPDYSYMTWYIRGKIIVKYKKYLQYLNDQKAI